MIGRPGRTEGKGWGAPEGCQREDARHVAGRAHPPPEERPGCRRNGVGRSISEGGSRRRESQRQTQAKADRDRETERDREGEGQIAKRGTCRQMSLQMGQRTGGRKELWRVVHGGRGSQEASFCSATERAAVWAAARWARPAKAMQRHGLCGAVGVTSPASSVGWRWPSHTAPGCIPPSATWVSGARVGLSQALDRGDCPLSHPTHHHVLPWTLKSRWAKPAFSRNRRHHRVATKCLGSNLFCYLQCEL